MLAVPDEKDAVKLRWTIPVRQAASIKWEAWLAPYARRPVASSRPTRRAKRESSCLHRRSLAVPVARDKFRAAHLQRFAPIEFLQTRHKIRTPGGSHSL